MDSPFSKAALDALVAAELTKPQASVSAPAPPPDKKGVSKWAQLATLGGHMGDAASTIYVQNKGGRDLNPVFGDHPSNAKVIGVKSGSAALQMLLQHLLGKRHPKLANGLGYGTGIGLGAVTAHNINVGKKSSR